MASRRIGQKVWLITNDVYTTSFSDERIEYERSFLGRRVFIRAYEHGFKHPYLVEGNDFQGWVDNSAIEEVRWKAKLYTN